ncbi:MAG: serine/threonine protein kinase [Myxococcota bacterium]|nr:serine/threonine protein kinase [Myxococcota bacterium]
MKLTSERREPVRPPEIGRYHLVAELARGGMGNVYLATTQGPGGFSKLLVIKELKPELSDDETYVSMFLDEARLAARLHHPNIVQTNEVASEGGRHFMVMEFLDGRSLHRIGKRFAGNFPVAAHLRVIGEALRGLHYAHELCEFDGKSLGIVHRDVSPLNVLVTFDGQAKILDFGIAKTVDSSLETKIGVLKGRVAYMSPEQAEGAKVDRRADIFSAGVMLWEAAAGRRLWPGMSEVEILTEVVQGRVPSLVSVRSDAPEDLQRICARAMMRDRDDRYATALELVHDIERHLAQRADAVTMREVGALVGQAFADERRKTNVLIEEAGTRVRKGPSRVMPALQPPVAGTPSNVGLPYGELRSLSSRIFTPSTSFPPTSAASASGNASHHAPPTSADLGPAEFIPQLRRWRSKWGVLAVSGASAIVLGALVLITALHSVRQAYPSEAARVPVVAASPIHEQPQVVELSIRVSPASAQITVDGASPLNNPFHSRYPKDGGIHRIIASADGYDPKVEDVLFASDVSIDLSLTPHTTVPLRQTAVMSAAAPMRPFRHASGVLPSGGMLHDPALAAPSTGPRPEATQGAGRPPLRPISTSNPYGTP